MIYSNFGSPIVITGRIENVKAWGLGGETVRLHPDHHCRIAIDL